MRQLLKNIAVVTPVLMQNQSGILCVSLEDESVFVSVFEGELVNDVNKTAFVKLIKDIQNVTITFVPQTIARTYQTFSLVSILWEVSRTHTNINEICQEYLYNKILKKGHKNIFYKLENLTNDDFLVYLFFIKSEIRTLQDLITFYPNKDKNKLEISAYRLFLVGELILGEEIALKNPANISADTVKTALLQRLLNKVSSLSYK